MASVPLTVLTADADVATLIGLQLQGYEIQLDPCPMMDCCCHASAYEDGLCVEIGMGETYPEAFQ